MWSLSPSRAALGFNLLRVNSHAIGSEPSRPLLLGSASPEQPLNMCWRGSCMPKMQGAPAVSLIGSHVQMPGQFGLRIMIFALGETFDQTPLADAPRCLEASTHRIRRRKTSPLSLRSCRVNTARNETNPILGAPVDQLTWHLELRTMRNTRRALGSRSTIRIAP